MLIICAGMIRSASTLQFQLVNAALKEAGIKYISKYCCNLSELKSFSQGHEDKKEYIVAKIHFSLSDYPTLLEQDNVSCFYVQRNSFDVAASLMRKTGKDFAAIESDLATALRAREFYLHNANVVVCGYDNILINNYNWLEIISSTLGLSLSRNKLKKIAESHSLAKQKKRISVQKNVKFNIGKAVVWSMGKNNSGDNYILLDPKTLLHKNHITSNGKSGNWKNELTHQDVLRISELEVRAALEAEQARNNKNIDQLEHTDNIAEDMREVPDAEPLLYVKACSDLESERREHVATKAVLGEKLSELAETKSQLEEAQAAYSVASQKYDQNISELEAERKSMADKLQTFSEKCRQFDLRLKEKEDSLKKADKSVDCLKSKYDSLIHQLAVAKSKLESKEDQIAARCNDINELHESLTKVSTKYRNFVIAMYAWQRTFSPLAFLRFKKLSLPDIPEVLSFSSPTKNDKVNKNYQISVITPSYNSGDFIERAIKSVLAQDYANWEHIIVDGGSTDNTVDILKKYPHLKWISAPDRGQVDAMNKGFKMATGDVITYLNADDYYLEGAFSSAMNAFSEDTKIVYGNVKVFDEAANKWWVNKPKTDFQSILRHWEPNAFCVNPVGYFYKREVQEKVPYREENGAKMDLAFLMEVALYFGEYTKKVDFDFGVFMNTADTQTVKQQSKRGYWTPKNFSFIDEFLEKLPLTIQTKYRKAQLAGYEQREKQRTTKTDTELSGQNTVAQPHNVAKGQRNERVLFPRYFCRTDLGLAYLSIPKNACSSIKYAMASVNRNTAFDLAVDPVRLHTEPEYFFDRIISTENGKPDKLFSFSFVRNPYDRFLSFYKEKIALKWDLRLEPYMSSCGFHLNMSIDECLDIISSLPLYAMNEHFAPQHSFLFQKDCCMVDYVGHVEDLSAGFDFIEENWNVHFIIPTFNTTKGKGLWIKLNESQRQRLRVIYKDDFELLGY